MGKGSLKQMELIVPPKANKSDLKLVSRWVTYPGSREVYIEFQAPPYNHAFFASYLSMFHIFKIKFMPQFRYT